MSRDWTQRLQKVQIETAKPDLEPIDHLTLADLQNEPVTFGKLHLGKSHEEVWQSSPDWTKWFLSHYSTSQTLAHRRMIKFIQLKIEQAEKEGIQPYSASSLPKAKAKGMAQPQSAQPKSLAMPTQGPVMPGEMTSQQGDLIEAMPWEPEDHRLEEMQSLQHRMLNLENAMQQIINLLAQERMNPSNVHEFPDVTEEEAWTDPWNQ